MEDNMVNPSSSLNVKRNEGKLFLKLLDRQFPRAKNKLK